MPIVVLHCSAVQLNRKLCIQIHCTSSTLSQPSIFLAALLSQYSASVPLSAVPDSLCCLVPLAVVARVCLASRASRAIAGVRHSLAVLYQRGLQGVLAGLTNWQGPSAYILYRDELKPYLGLC